MKTNKLIIEQSGLLKALNEKGFSLTESITGYFIDESEGPLPWQEKLEAVEIVKSFGFTLDNNTEAIQQP